MTERTEAIKIVAATIVSSIELPDWAQYPDIEMGNWQDVIQCCESMLASITEHEHYTAEDFRQAYDALSSTEGERE